MVANKTRPTDASVEGHLASRATPAQMSDCTTIMDICHRVTKQEPYMWGPSIVGYGSYTYSYDSGRSGEAPLAGFAVRGREIVVYLGVDDPGQAELLARLGRHRMGKSCLYIKRLSEIDVGVLEELISLSVAETRRRHG